MVTRAAVVAAAMAAAFLLIAAASAQTALDTGTVKGSVVERTEETLLLTPGGSARYRVMLTPRTVVRGQRRTVQEIAVHDYVRVDGRFVNPQRIEANVIEVLLTAGGLSISANRAGLAGVFWNWILNGGITIPVK